MLTVVVFVDAAVGLSIGWCSSRSVGMSGLLKPIFRRVDQPAALLNQAT